MSGERHGPGNGRNMDSNRGCRDEGRSRSPRPGLAAEAPCDFGPPVAVHGSSTMGSTPTGAGICPGVAPRSAATTLGPSMAQPPMTAPPGPMTAQPGVRAPIRTAMPGGLATAAALSQQLPLQQAAVAASQAARAAAAALPSGLPSHMNAAPSGASVAILEAQVASLGALLLALQGIVIQLIAVVNLMRSGM